MDTLTRGEKIDRALENAKRVAIKVLLILWAVLTMFLAIGFAGNHVQVKHLEEQLERVESEYTQLQNHVEAIYVYHR